MVLIVDHKVAVNEATQEEFVMLVIQGDPVMVQSQETGRYYLTARKTSIPCTFTQQVANVMIGSKLPGAIKKIPCETYDYTIQETGEVIELDHTWEYAPDKTTRVIETVNPEFSRNGVDKSTGQNGILEPAI